VDDTVIGAASGAGFDGVLTAPAKKVPVAPPSARRSSGLSFRPRRTRGTRCAILCDVVAALVVAAPIVAALAVSGAAWTRPALVVVEVPVLLVLLAWQGLYRGDIVRTIPSGLEVFTRVAKSVPMLALVVAVTLTLGGMTDTRGVLALAAAATIPLVIVLPTVRSVANALRRRFVQNSNERVLIVGCGESADRVARRLELTGDFTIVGTVDDDPPPGFKSIGGIADIETLCEKLDVDRVVVTTPSTPWNTMADALLPLISVAQVSVVAPMYEIMTWRSGLAEVSGLPMIPLVGSQRTLLARMAKRTVDIVGAIVGLVVLSPLLAAAAVAVKCTSPGPVIFRQRRAGLQDQVFCIFKFRTMRVDAEEYRAELLDRNEADGPRFKMAKDPRVTRVGAFLRKYSIDELPQLLNVLDGSMSLVGPRPFPLVESGALHVGAADSRFEVKPGMTGLWQVSGRSDLSWEELCQLDAIYVRSWSFAWDLRILMQTPVVALRRQGAY
jgi:exopolysaccharide biosynthesis polyprenyl glycosylphosphotransferase